jgi:hypothetical protein
MSGYREYRFAPVAIGRRSAWVWEYTRMQGGQRLGVREVFFSDGRSLLAQAPVADWTSLAPTFGTIVERYRPGALPSG